jgi:hypothetical protein
MNTQFCTLKELAEYVNTVNSPLTNDEIKGAIINLCDHLTRAQQTASHAANTASCLANGILPD